MKRKWPARMPVRQLPEPAPATGELIKVRRAVFLARHCGTSNQLRVGVGSYQPFHAIISYSGQKGAFD